MEKRIFLLIVTVFAICSALAQQSTPVALKTPKDKIDQFMDLRFGMFIHFGAVTLRGTEIGWSRNQQVAQDDYDSLYKEFNPALFNADAWVKAAKDAGMKYLTITAKHHDGFCLWPTAYSGYNISNSPFKRDIVGELAKACKKQGIVFCIYCTVLDWHDADYPIHNPNDKKFNVKGDMRAFVNRMKNELHELITNYKPAMLWFDGFWEEPWTKEYGQEVYQYIKTVDPKVVINNRLGKGEPTKFSEGSVGDYLTPEQQIGKLDMVNPWESCITICNQWAWKPNDSMKSLKECLQTLAKTAGGNGNLLFNVGPMMDGRMEARQIKRLAEIGNWLKQNGTAIYSTKGGPYKPNDSYAATRKGDKIYIEIFKRDGATLNLPALPGIKITKAAWLGGNALTFTQNDGIQINLPETLPDENVSVIELDIDKNAELIPVI
ncbi:MAG: alpha-L-fucosidase [Bacteroidota bacterium]|nr:alpha-L-fucosidase [Bacteroidota bacterium]